MLYVHIIFVFCKGHRNDFLMSMTVLTHGSETYTQEAASHSFLQASG